MHNWSVNSETASHSSNRKATTSKEWKLSRNVQIESSEILHAKARWTDKKSMVSGMKSNSNADKLAQISKVSSEKSKPWKKKSVAFRKKSEVRTKEPRIMKRCCVEWVRNVKNREGKLRWVSNRPLEALRNWARKGRRFGDYLSPIRMRSKRTNNTSNRCIIKCNKKKKNYQHSSMNLPGRAPSTRINYSCSKMKSKISDVKAWQTNKKSKKLRKCSNKTKERQRQEWENLPKPWNKKDARAWLTKNEPKI